LAPNPKKVISPTGDPLKDKGYYDALKADAEEYDPVADAPNEAFPTADGTAYGSSSYRGSSKGGAPT
jgi:hypothetical protein